MQSSVEKLSEKVSQILQQYHSLKGENEMLRTEVGALKETLINNDAEIKRLHDENAMKDLEIEEVVAKIENILG